MKPESPNKATYRRFVERIINDGEFDLIPDLFHADYLDHSAPPGAPGGLDGVAAVFRMFRGGFPDVHFEIKTMLEEGDKVATRVTGEGTHAGPFMGLEPSGKHATWSSHGIFRVRDGKIVEHWGQPDLLALLSQIGGIPPEAGVGPPADTSHLTPHPDVPPENPHDPECLALHRRLTTWAHEVAFSQGDVSEADRYIAADYVDHPPARPYAVALLGPESLRQDVDSFRLAFPDLITTAEDIVAEGNQVAVRGRWRGTHCGDFFGFPPSGRPFDVEGINFFRFADGQFVERYGTWDVLTLMRQLDLVPTAAQPAASH